MNYYRYGCKLYPYFFKISLIIFSVDFIQLFIGKFNEWLLIALICYLFFFIGIFIAYILKNKQIIINV